MEDKKKMAETAKQILSEKQNLQLQLKTMTMINDTRSTKSPNREKIVRMSDLQPNKNNQLMTIPKSPNDKHVENILDHEIKKANVDLDSNRGFYNGGFQIQSAQKKMMVS